MRIARSFALVLLALFAFALPTVAAERAILILDGSGSMWARLDSGETRIEVARETLEEVLGNLPDELELGFMAYGHRERGDCSDIELMVAPGPGTAPDILDAAASINPKGKTPISAAVLAAAEELSYGEEKATVIHITDANETCEADPCELGAELEASGVDFTTHVVGFGLSDEEGAQVACLAEETGGIYIAADDAPKLVAALNATVKAAVSPPPAAMVEPEREPEPVVVAAAPDYSVDPVLVLTEGADPLLASEGDVVWEIYRATPSGEKGDYVTTEYGAEWRGTLEPGDYLLRATLGAVSREEPFRVAPGEVAEPYFVMDAGRLIVRPYKAEGEPVDFNAPVYTLFPDGTDTTNYGETNIYVPAGETSITVTIGSAEVTETAYVEAGEVVEVDIVLGVGRVVLNAYYIDDMKVEDGSLFVEVFKARKALDGTRESMGYAYGPDGAVDLPPGDYVAVATLGNASAEAEFEIESGALSEAWATLDAGVLAVEAPNWGFIEVFLAKKDIAGNRKGAGYINDGSGQLTLHGGDYVLLLHDKVDSLKTREVETSVVAGERTELNIDD